MERGFKTQAENKAREVRAELHLRATAALPARRLADHLEVIVVGPHDIPGMTQELLEQLLEVDPWSWSATTITHAGTTVTIHNTSHSPCRQESDVMHELAHLICGHQPTGLIQLPGFPFPLRKFEKRDEDEAGWLGGCLQLPRPALLWGALQGLSEDEMVAHFGASVEMIRYRRQKTGVAAQVTRMRSGVTTRMG